MSAVANPEHTAGHDEGYGGALRWITTTNHKDIGTLYLWFSLIMFAVGGIAALIIRAELFSPGLQTCRRSTSGTPCQAAQKRARRIR